MVCYDLIVVITAEFAENAEPLFSYNSQSEGCHFRSAGIFGGSLENKNIFFSALSACSIEAGGEII